MKRDVTAEIGRCREKAAGRTEGALRQRRFIEIRSVRLQSVAHGAPLRGYPGEFERGGWHVEFGENLALHIGFVRDAGCLGDDSTQQAEGVIRILVARSRRRGKRNSAE